MTTSNIEQAALQIRSAYETGAPCTPVRELLDEQCLESAYAVQKINSDYWQSQGRRVVGVKALLTDITRNI
jgi:2-keto-4-pentenoate hydratase